EIGGRRLADGRNVVSIVLSDGRDCLEGVWFNQVYMASKFRYGQRVAFSGKPKRYQDHWQMTNPRVSPLSLVPCPSFPPGTTDPRDKGQRTKDKGQGTKDEGPIGIVPVYPLTEDLRADQLRALIRKAVDGYARHVPEILPAELRQQRAFPE